MAFTGIQTVPSLSFIVFNINGDLDDWEEKALVTLKNDIEEYPFSDDLPMIFLGDPNMPEHGIFIGKLFWISYIDSFRELNEEEI